MSLTVTHKVKQPQKYHLTESAATLDDAGVIASGPRLGEGKAAGREPLSLTNELS
jgi:hypothetical protein